MPGRNCSVCTHEGRANIDRALVAGQTLRSVSLCYGMSATALFRHKSEHLPALLGEGLRQRDVHAAETAAEAVRQEAREARQALDVVQQLKAINSATLQILMDAGEAGDPGTALRAIDRIQRQIELQAKLLGELDESPKVAVMLSPEWLQVRTTLLHALQPHPEAKFAVAGALARLDASNGHG